MAKLVEEACCEYNGLRKKGIEHEEDWSGGGVVEGNRAKALGGRAWYPLRTEEEVRVAGTGGNKEMGVKLVGQHHFRGQEKE